MTRTILVALDGSPSAEGALPAATALAGALDARLALVQPVAARSHDSAGRVCRVSRAHEALQACAARVHADNPFLHVGVSAPIGPWLEAVLDEAALECAELIVVDRRLPGSLALSRRCELPLLLVPPNGGGCAYAARPAAALHVLVPLDGSPTAEAILPLLVRLGARQALRATVLHVQRAAHPWLGAHAYCRRVASWLGRHGVPAKVEVRSGDSVEEICRAALDLALDPAHDGGGLLALGLPQALPWRFGYAAERIVRSVPLPVLQLRSPRCEHVVPLDETGAALASLPLDALLTPAGQRDHRAHRGALAGGRL